MHITTGIIAVPASVAQSIADLMIEQGLWESRFFPSTQVPQNIVVQQENLVSSLAILMKKLEKEVK